MIVCTNCQKGPPEITIRRCAKCSTTPYCSRACQKADWKVHKKVCVQATEPSSGSTPFDWSPADPLSPPQGLDHGIAKPFTRLDTRTWLHNRSEKDTYRLLIDAFRMAVTDAYNFDGIKDKVGIFGDKSNVLVGFQEFLNAVESRPNLLPPWWNASKRRECEGLAMDGSQWWNLKRAVNKAGIQDHYGDTQFPMQLRMFAEDVYGRGPGGADGTAMRKMKVSMEGGELGDMYEAHIDWAALLN